MNNKPTLKTLTLAASTMAALSLSPALEANPTLDWDQIGDQTDTIGGQYINGYVSNNTQGTATTVTVTNNVTIQITNGCDTGYGNYRDILLLEQGTTFTVGTDLRIARKNSSSVSIYGTASAVNVYIGKDDINASDGAMNVYSTGQLSVAGDFVVSGVRTTHMAPPPLGPYTVKDGKLQMQGGVVTANAAKLGGVVGINNGGSISAGTVYAGSNAEVEIKSGGTITSTGDWFISSGATFAFELNSGLLSTAAILGNGTLGTVLAPDYTTSTAAPTGINLNLSVAVGTTFQPGDVLKLFDNMPFVSDAVSSPVISAGGYTFAVLTDGSGLSVQVIPEPGTYALCGGVGAALLALAARWRRRQK
ncbi:MAG: hypothetical protein LBD14_02380 [Puniceicoccales bacterium]|jgi:hypothetical protein|nr:hypothetical protein [Puniceicoccales bacterium]